MPQTLYVVIPCTGNGQGIEESLLSVATQEGDFRLRLHVQGAGIDDALTTALDSWQDRLNDLRNAPLCRDLWFSHCATPTGGVYDAITKGIETLALKPERFVTWLRAGDRLLPGALAHIAAIATQFQPGQVDWISGALAHVENGCVISAVDVPMPRDILVQGLADGRHWPFLQQGGMFFRSALWQATCGPKLLQGEDCAAEWQLWQQFAAQADLVQSPEPLAACRILPLELPLHLRIRARRRIEAAMPTDTRLPLLKSLLQAGLTRLCLTASSPELNGLMQVVKEDLTPTAQDWALRRFGQGLEYPRPTTTAVQLQLQGASPVDAPDEIAMGHLIQQAKNGLLDLPAHRAALPAVPRSAKNTANWLDALAPLARILPPRRSHPIWRANRMCAWDQDWSTDRATEQQAFHQIRALALVPFGTGYIGFPWDSLIAARAAGTADAPRLMQGLEVLCQGLPAGVPRITTCQHPDMMAHLAVFSAAGITDIFWPWLTAANRQHAENAGIRLHAMAHCPAATLTEQAVAAERPKLMIRLDHDTPLPTPKHGADKAVFALCPAGAGGNSPALWHAIAAGAIPVLPLAKTGPALPGDPGLWQQAAVFIPDTERDGLTEHLATIARAPARLSGLQQGAAQIRLLYGTLGPALDILALMAVQGGKTAPLSAPPLSAPPRKAPPNIGRAPKICFYGPRGARTALSYAPFRRLARDRFSLAERPEDADLILTGWNRDLEENASGLSAVLRRNPSVKFAVISEEPLWDIVWSDGYEARDRVFDCAGQAVPYRYLNHMNSRIFDFDTIPYFILTDPAFIPRYVSMLAKFADMRPYDLLARWRIAPYSSAFVSEARSGAEFDLHGADGTVQGLSCYRTEVARQIDGKAVLRIGQGWPDQGPRRQTLPDWHLDKLVRLSGQVRLCSAYENTHQHSYITEKLFDAFAVGAIPICYAGPQHRIHDLVSPGSMLNTWGQPASVAAIRVQTLRPDTETAETWLQAAAALRHRLADSPAAIRERQRVVTETMREITAWL